MLFFFQEGVPTVQPVSLSDYHMFHQEVQVGAAVLLMNPRVHNPQRAGPHQKGNLHEILIVWLMHSATFPEL